MKKGTVDADTARDAREKLRRQDVRVTEMNRVEAGAKREKGAPKPILQRGIGVRVLATFTRQFATLLRSGVHLAQGLGVLVDQVEDRRLEVTLRDIRERVVGGISLAEAMSFHPLHFSDLYCNMVRAGEASGNLDDVLESLADYMEAQANLRAKVSAAMTYPAVMVVVGLSVVVFLMSFVVPRITEILVKKGNVLPAPTQILIATSNFMKGYWWVILIGLVVGIVNFRLFIATEKGRMIWDTNLLRIPVFGTLFKKQAISRFCVTLSTLVKSGLPVHESLLIVGKVVNNALMTKVIQEIHDRILEGADISTPVRSSKIFPPMVGYMISVGEQSGQLEDVLDRIADTYEGEIEHAVQRLTSLVEPMIIIFLAVVVGFIVLSVLLPLLQFSNI